MIYHRMQFSQTLQIVEPEYQSTSQLIRQQQAEKKKKKKPTTLTKSKKKYNIFLPSYFSFEFFRQ